MNLVHKRNLKLTTIKYVTELAILAAEVEIWAFILSYSLQELMSLIQINNGSPFRLYILLYQERIP